MWREKAERLIAAYAMQAHQASDGLRCLRPGRRKHVPYRLPAVAEALVECLRTDDEYRAKALFIRLAFIPETGND